MGLSTITAACPLGWLGFLAPLVYLGCGLLGEGSRIVELGEELVPWDVLFRVGPMGDLHLGGIYWMSVPFVGTGNDVRRITLAVWLRGSLMVLET